MTRSRTIFAQGIPVAALLAALLPVCAVACAVDDRELGLAGEGAADGAGSGTGPEVALPALSAGRVLATARRSFDFGVIPPGQTATGVIVAGNIGDQTVTDVAASIDGPFASEFSAVPSAQCSELRSRASCSVNLTFVPQGTGPRQARLVLSAPDTPPLELQLRGGTPIVDEEATGSGSPPGNGASSNPPGSGVPGSNPPGSGVPGSGIPGSEGTGTPGGTSGSLQLSFSDLRFPDLEVQQPSEVVEVTVQNTAATSSGPLQVASDAPLEFLVDTTCGAALAPGAECSVSVQFRPATGGERSGRVLISDGLQQAALFVSGAGQYRLTVVRAGEGVGAVSGLGIDCGATCSGLFTPGSVSLSAATSNGSDSFFTGWSGSPTCTGPLRDCVLNL
ncbi:MAG TPA: choice-of-anchor D domain-containing protein, partial [Polyangiaceae bacterium]|nr:choice-of-anchor D domain-containing protein [Polyangiaceae bacterium]